MNCWTRLMLVYLVAAVVAGLSLACARDDPAPPSPLESTPISSPGPVAATVSPAATSVPTAAGPVQTLRATEPAAAATGPAAGPTVVSAAVSASPESAGGSLRLISSRAAAVPSSVPAGLLSAGFSGGRFSYGSHSSASPQAVPTEGGLTVSATGAVTVAADEAYVVVVPEQYYGPSGPEQMTGQDRRQIRENLAQLGISEEAVEFGGLARYGPAGISVAVELAELAGKREQVLEAVEQVVRRYESHGIIYSLTEENCEGALSLARREAIPRAEKSADDLAQALGVSRGMVIGALEYPLTSHVFGPFSANIRACGAQAPSPYPSLVPFDAGAEVEVTVGYVTGRMCAVTSRGPACRRESVSSRFRVRISEVLRTQAGHVMRPSGVRKS